MKSIITMALKDLRLLARDRFGLFWVIAFPLIMALFFGSIFSSGGSRAGSMKIAYVGDASKASIDFQKQLSASEVLSVFPKPLDSARLLVARGKLTAYVKFTDTSQGSGSFFSPGKPSIEIGVDPSRRAEVGYLKGLINQAFYSGIQKKMTDPTIFRQQLQNDLNIIDSAKGISNQQREYLKGFMGNLDSFMETAKDDTVKSDSNSSSSDFSPFGQLEINEVQVATTTRGPRSSWEITFPQGIMWALIGCAAAFALSIVTERTRGTFLRLQLAPITRIQVLAGKGLACFIACLTVASLLILFGIIVFGIRVASPLGLIAALVCTSLCFVGLMMLISVIGKTEQAVGGAGWAIMLVMSMTGDGMVPLMFMPKWMFTIGHISPVKWGILAMEGAIWRGFSYMEMMTPLLVLLGFGLICFIAGVMILARSEN